ncbi:fibroblast growth factor receptor-like 1, partial [Saccoglossus kowalevskii]
MVDASIGESVRFSCAATAYPTPSVIWYNKGKPITDFSNYLETSQTLIILYALPEDSGQYSCHVTNGHGDIWRNYSLSVGKNAVSDINSFAEYSSDEESILANYELEPRNNSMETPPYFTSPQKMSRTSLTKTIGGYVRLRCPSGGHPEPEIKWSKNGHVLDSENLGYK